VATRRGLIHQARERLAYAEPRTFTWPEHFVSTRFRAPVRGEEPDCPHGVRRARACGSLQTVCGLSAVGWLYFWMLGFDPLDSRSCEECARILGQGTG
jgi:hypothetical protein